MNAPPGQLATTATAPATAPASVATTAPASAIATAQLPPTSAIGVASYCRLLRNTKCHYGPLQDFKLSVRGANRAVGRRVLDEKGIMGLVPEEYHDFLPRFEEAVANQLPPHRKSDHTIPLKDGFQPPFGQLYTLSRFELEALKAWLEEILKKVFIRASFSPSGVPILFFKKQDGSLRLYMNYRGLNEGTIKNRYPLPFLQETLMRLFKSRWFTKLDV